MATEVKTQTTLPAAILNKLGNALQRTLDAARNSGQMLSDFVAECVGAKLSDVVPAADVDAIVQTAYPDGAYDPKVLKVRRSEARNIVRAHAGLPEGLTALKSAKGKTTYADTVNLARRIANGEAPAAAVAAMVAPGGAVDHAAKFERAAKSYHKVLTDSTPRSDKGKKHKADTLAALNALGTALGIKF